MLFGLSVALDPPEPGTHLGRTFIDAEGANFAEKLAAIDFVSAEA
jgi:hypothetical protein